MYTADAISIVVPNALSRYFSRLTPVLEQLAGNSSGGFEPDAKLPPLDQRLQDFFAVSDLRFFRLPEYRGRKMALLDLTGNPGTRTTKTFASLLIVARAVSHIQRTGEGIMIISPSSGNKATALRDAVARAIRADLAQADQLRVASVVPAQSMPKLWASELSADPLLRRKNPVAVLEGGNPEAVKDVTRKALFKLQPEADKIGRLKLWYTLDLRNYMAADVVRAFAEKEYFPMSGDERRLHVHAVSSAFGLLGHARGIDIINGDLTDSSLFPAYFLVQHLGAPDMVLSLVHGSGKAEYLPRYSYQPQTDLFTQDADPHFPAATFDPHETLDQTFYTRMPATSERMNQIIRRQGGGGIVVSLAECLDRYAFVRALLAGSGFGLPDDPRTLREWALVMAVTGVLNGIDRGIVPETDILVHASGSYAVTDYTVLPPNHLYSVDSASQVADVIRQALS